MDNLTTDEKTEVEAVLAVLSSEPVDQAASDPDKARLQMLAYRAANDNTEHAWLRWLGLALILLVPISLVVALLRRAL